MRSAYAVTGQLAVSASNYAIFVIFAQALEGDAFVAFSTAVGLNMLAWAIAEGGVSYVAPLELSKTNGGGEGRIAGAFLTLSGGLYLTIGAAGFLVWNALAQDGLSLAWCTAYATFVLPTLLIPSWVTCWSLDLVGVMALVAARGAIVLAAIIHPSSATLLWSGLAFGCLVVWLLGRLNRGGVVVAWTDVPSLVTAARHLREVFFAKNISYALYGLTPMVVGLTRGSSMAAEYVTGERLKALYTTLFQPVVQTAYLAQFGASPRRTRGPLVEWGLHSANVVLLFVLLLAGQLSLVGLLGARFVAVPDLPVYLVAAGLSVTSAAILYLRVFPAGAMATFRAATVTQAIVFVAAFGVFGFVPGLSAAWVLGAAEAGLLVALLVALPGMTARRAARVRPEGMP